MKEDTFATPAELSAYSAAHRLGYLIGSAQNVVDHWDSPWREDARSMTLCIGFLRKAIQEAKS